MNDELNKLLTETKFEVCRDVVEYMFNNINAETQEEINVKSALLKQAFLNSFDLEFEKAFLNASEKLL